MTGIERLREFAKGCRLTGQKAYSNAIGDIADQIEREQGSHVSRMRVLSVITDMERHVLGHEGMEDSPVARWARELREALGGDERDHADEREAIAWVREHGGLERVKWLLDWCLSHDSKIEQLDFDYWLSGRVMHELGFEGDMADRDEVERRLLARLVPEGMEWPRFEDGEPVRCGDEALLFDRPQKVGFIQFFDTGIFLQSDDNDQQFSYGERVKRPVVDTWERLEKDAEKGTCVYFGQSYGCGLCSHYPSMCIFDKARDLVRRAKALAGGA